LQNKAERGDVGPKRERRAKGDNEKLYKWDTVGKQKAGRFTGGEKTGELKHLGKENSKKIVEKERSKTMEKKKKDKR